MKKGVTEMNWKKEMKAIVVSSLITASLIFCFYLIWYLRVGQVPIENSIKITPSWTLLLPFQISSWWKILIGPIGSIIAIVIFIIEEKKADVADVFSYFFGLFFGLGFALIFGLNSSLTTAVSAFLLMGLLIIVFALLCEEPINRAVLTFGLAASLIFGIFYGPAFGLAFGLSYGLGYGLILVLFIFCVIILPFSLKYLFNSDFRYMVRKWGVM